ncbi:MAG: hypothetical protein FWB71_02435 [Defluviitaleaceae bacterium]|nr:hypothetical protein [Defluviitaleaceae bacterium]
MRQKIKKILLILLAILIIGGGIATWRVYRHFFPAVIIETIGWPAQEWDFNEIATGILAGDMEAFVSTIYQIDLRQARHGDTVAYLRDYRVYSLSNGQQIVQTTQSRRYFVDRLEKITNFIYTPRNIGDELIVIVLTKPDGHPYRRAIYTINGADWVNAHVVIGGYRE